MSGYRLGTVAILGIFGQEFNEDKSKKSGN
jgi:hypothetical protein